MKRTFALLAAMLLLAGLPFAQTLGNGIKIATVTGGVRWAQCAFGPDAVLHVCFEEDTNRGHPIWYVKYDGTTASTPFMVTDSMDVVGERPGIAVGSHGHIAVLWGTNSGKSIYMRVYDPHTKAWGGVETVKVGYGYEEPCAAIDNDGNIFTFWSDGDGGRVYSRAKINGVWEDTYKHNGSYGKQGGICLAPNGTIYAAWREKIGNNYKNYYAKRTKTTSWSASASVTTSGGSSSHPFIGVGPNSIPVVVWGDIDPLNETGAEIRLIRLETGEPREIIIPFAMQHYPRPAVDVNNKIHVAAQAGGGDFGNGCYYTNNVSGSWMPSQGILSSMDKVPGISADGYGNVAVCMSNMVTGGGSEIYVWSLQRIEPRYLYAPINLSSSLQIKNVRHAPQITYSLAWATNPTNTDAYVSGYNLYVKEGDGAYQPLLFVNKATLAATFTFTDLSKKRHFAIATVNPGGGESDLIEF